VSNGASSGGTGSGSASTTTTTTPGTATTAPAATTVPPASGSSADLITQAAQKYDQAQAALKTGDFTTYATLIQEVGTLVKQAQAQAAAGK